MSATLPGMDMNEFRLRAERGEIPTVDPKLQNAARSGNRYAQREMERQAAAQERQAQQDAEQAQRDAERAQARAAREQKAIAAHEQAVAVRKAAADGIQTVTDIETGKRSIKTNPDGTPAYKVGEVGPPKVTTVQPAGPTPEGGNIAPITQVSQTYRNTKGETITAPLEQKTDPKTGQTYVERKDEFGRPARMTTGVDPDAQKKLALEQESAKLDIHRNNIEQQRLQIEPQWKAHSETYQAAKKQLDQPLKFTQQDGKWVETDTGLDADPQKLSEWQKERGAILAQYKAAASQYGKMLPVWNNIEKQQTEIRARKLQIDSQRTALEHGLPLDDGGTAETLTRQQTGEQNPANEQVMRDLALVPGMGSVIDLANNDQNWQPSTPSSAAPEEPTKRPLMPADDEGKRALFITAFSGLRNADQYQVGKSEKGWTWIQRNGQNVASIDADPQTGEPSIVLNPNIAQQGTLRDTISLGNTSGTIPIYLADNGAPKDQRKEAAYVASVFQELRDNPALQDEKIAAGRLKELGADPASILRKVNSGELSVQRGEAMMKNLYGGTLKSTDPEDPVAMQKWLQETKTRADKTLQDKYGNPNLKDPNSAGRQWEAASTGLGTSATTKNQIHQDFLRDNYLENRGKPGVQRAKYLALHQKDLADNMTLGENVLSKLHAVGKSVRDDVLGSMVGIAAGGTLALGQAEAAILGSDKAAAQFKEDMRLRNRDFASWTNSAARNIKAWTTPTGIKTAAAFDQALSAFQRAIDADEQSPTEETKAAVAATEQAARQAALAMHNLAPDESWPTTEENLDPAKDQGLASAINGYRTTADPRFFSLYRDRMLMGNGRRQYSSELERKIGPSTGGFFSSMDHAMYAGWQEVASEVAADTIAIASGGASKAIQAGLKGIGMTARATRLGKFSGAIARGLSAIDEIGLAKGTLQRPLTGMQKARNIGIQTIKGMAGEGGEELAVEIGSENPQLLQAFGGGVLGVIDLSPAMVVSHFVASTDMPQRTLDQRNAKWANRYNTLMAGSVGFQPITPQDANTARSFIDPRAHQALTTALTAKLEEINAAPEPATEEESAARQQTRADIEATLHQIAERTESAITAAKQISELKDPQEQAFYSGLAKVATGNHSLLTTNERKAIQGRQTEAGADYFAAVPMPDGTTVETVTPEARAEALMRMPAVGKLIQTTESQAIIDQQIANMAPPEQQAPTATAQAANGTRLQGTPEQQQQAAQVAQTVMQRIAAEYPALAARVSIGQADPNYITGGIAANITEDGSPSISIIPEDITHSIAAGNTPEQMVEKTVDNIVLHETLHTLQFQLAGKDAKSFYTALHGQMTPAMLANARELYGTANWDGLDPWQQAAEVVRMLAEAKIAGRTTDVHRLTQDASPELLARLAEIIKQIIDAITTGTVPESVKQHVDALTELYNELLNAPSTPNTSPANPATDQQSATPGQDGAGTGAAPEGERDSSPAGTGEVDAAPGDDTGASDLPSPELIAARQLSAAALKQAIADHPYLKQNQDLMDSLDDATWDLAELIAGMTEPQAKAYLSRTISEFLQRPEVQEARQQRKERIDAYRAEAARKISEKAREILNSDKYKTLSRIFQSGRIARKPNALAMILQKRHDGGVLSEKEQQIARNESEWNGMPTDADMLGNAIAREVRRMLFAPQGEDGRMPNKILPDMTASDLWMAVSTELESLRRGTLTEDSYDDPNREFAPDEINAILAARPELDPARHPDQQKSIAGLIEQIYGSTQSIATKVAIARRVAKAQEKTGPPMMDTPDGPEVDVDALTEQIQKAADSVLNPPQPKAKPTPAPKPQPATPAPQEKPRSLTPAQQAPINDRVGELANPMQDGLIHTEAVLDPAPLKAAQNHLPSLTRITGTPLVKRVILIAERIIPYFQGNKLKMTAPVVSAAEQYWTPEQRAAITTLHDLFGGGGAWALTLAEMFPNLREIHINEYDEVRAIKIRAQIEYGDQFAAIADSKPVRNAIASMIAAHRMRPAVQRRIQQEQEKGLQQNFIEEPLTPEEIAEMNEAWSWGVINKTAAQYAKSLNTESQDRIVAILKTMADDPERSGPWFKNHPDTEPSVDEIVEWFKSRHAPKAAAIKARADELAARGVQTITVTTGDAYTADVTPGPATMVVADPPYFATTGYADDNQKSVVGTDIYQRSALLMEDLVTNQNNIIYTDEAWWLRKSIDNSIRPTDLVEGQKLAERIGNTLDFMVVADQIDSRYETLGLFNPSGSPVASSRSASGSRDLRGNDQGPGDGGGNRGGGRTATVEVPARTDDQAGIQPSGDATPTTEEGLSLSSPAADVRSEAFKSFFGDWETDPAGSSKVVDSEGNPMLVFHGTKWDFPAISINPRKGAAFFSSNREMAGMMAQGPSKMHDVPRSIKASTAAPRVISAYLNLRNPFDHTNPAHIALLRQNGPRLADITLDMVARGAWFVLEKPGVVAAMQRAGFDGFLVREADKTMGQHQNYAVFSSDQIRQVDSALYSPAAETPRQKSAAIRSADNLELTDFGYDSADMTAEADGTNVDDYADNPISTGPADDAVAEFMGKDSDLSGIPSSIIPVPIDRIESEQMFVHKPTLKQHIRNLDSMTDREGKANPVEMIYKDGIYYLRDGNHRVNAARLLGRNSITAKVYYPDFSNQSAQSSVGDSPFDVRQDSKGTWNVWNNKTGSWMAKEGYGDPTQQEAEQSAANYLEGYNRATRSLYSPAPDVPPFYSQLQRTLEAKMPAMAPPMQVMQIATSGAKAEEIKWSGIQQAVQRIAAEYNGKVPKDQLLAWLRDEGSVRLEEVTLSDPTGKAPKDWFEEQLMRPEDVPQNRPKYAQYTLPGGENYREVVLAMPDANPQNVSPSAAVIAKYKDQWDDLVKKADALSYDQFEERGKIDAKLDILHGKMVMETVANMPANYTSSHFPDVPNYVAHMRLNERTDASGAPGLFIEELQSDRHQAGREKGYKSEMPTDDDVRRFFDLKPDVDPADYRDEMIQHRDHQKGAVADAPYRKDWPLALFKRALRDAVASGKEWIGWTVGETQQDRFDLSKQIDRVVATPSETRPGMIRVEAYVSGGTPVIDKTVTPEELPDLIGKDLARKIIDDIANPLSIDQIEKATGLKLVGDSIRWKDGSMSQFATPDDAKSMLIREYNIDHGNSDRAGVVERVYKGVDLKVGGEGMNGFYDNILPKEIGKYVKQWGGKVEQSSVTAQDISTTTIAEKIELAAENAQGELEDDLAEALTESAARIAGALYSGDSYAEAMRAEREYGDDGAASYLSNILAGQGIHEANNTHKITTPIHRVTITPEMRKGVQAGQALFSPAAEAPSAQYRYLKAKQEKQGLTPAENDALLRAERNMGQSFAFDMDRMKGSGNSTMLVRDRNQFPGEDYPVPPNVVYIQPRGLDTEPLTDRVWTFPYDGTAEDAARVGSKAFSMLDAQVYGVSQRESIFGASGPDGMAAYRMAMDHLHNRVTVRAVTPKRIAPRIESSPEQMALFSPASAPEGWVNGVHFTSNTFDQFDHEKAKQARDNARSRQYNPDAEFDVKPGYTTEYGRGFVFPGRAFFFFIGDAPQTSPVGPPIAVHLKLDNALDLTQQIPGETMGKIIDFVKSKVNEPARPGHHGHTAKGTKLGGFKNARENGATAQQLWDFLNDNTYITRARMWDEMLAAIGKDAVIFHGNSSGTFIGEAYRGRGNGKTYTIAAVVDTEKIRIAKPTTDESKMTLASPASTPRIRRSIGELEELAKSQENFRFWFQDFRGFLEDFLGPNKEYAPLVSEFLNATSAASTVGSNVAAMIKALREYIETGTFVSSFLPAHRGNLDRAHAGETLSGPKISEYSDAVFGIETAVPVDRHIAQLLFNTDKPTASQIAAAKLRVAKVGIRLGWTPRQTMATLWAANIARNGRTPQSYERYIAKHRFEIKRLLTADREGNQRGLKASRRIAARIEQRRDDARTVDGRAAGSDSLASPASDNQAAVDAALEKLPLLYREVFRAATADPSLTPEDLGRKFGIPARGAENIINQIRTRIRSNLESVAPGGLSPQGNSGRPDLGYSTVPSLQRVDQIRAQEGLPLQQTTEEIRRQAEELLRNPNATEALSAATEDWSAVQTAAANIALVNYALQGRNDLQVAKLAAAYREQGSRWSETGRARQDVSHSPGERHAMILADLLTTPDASTAAGLKKTKTTAEREAILANWVSRVKGIKESLKDRGIDLDEALQRFGQQVGDANAAESAATETHRKLLDALQAQIDDLQMQLTQATTRAKSAATAAEQARAEADAAKAAQALTAAQDAAQQAAELDPANTIRLELRKLTKRHQQAVMEVRNGATWDQAATLTGMTTEEVRRLWVKVGDAIEDAAYRAITLAEDILFGNQSLAAPASLAAASGMTPEQRRKQIARAFRDAAGYSATRGSAKPAATGKKKQAQKTDRPEPPMMSDEQLRRHLANPDTHRPLWQYEMAVTQPQSRLSFDEWIAKPETKAHIARQERMLKEPVSATTGTLDMHDARSVAAVQRELHASRSGMLDKVLEFWRMSVLSGPQTAIVNTGSNVAHTLYHLGPRRIVEAGLNDVLGVIGQGNKDAATFGELAVMARHIHGALARAGRNMLMAWNNETRIAEWQFMAAAQQTDFAGMKEDYVPPAIGGKFGTLMRSISFRHMTAADEFIKAFHGHLEAAAQAHRIAKQEKLTDTAYEQRITELMQEGSQAWSRALASAEDVTFQRKLNTKDPRALAVLDKIAAGVKRGTRRYPALSFFFPFVNTPTNIFKAAIEMSPAGGVLAVIDGARALKIRIARGNMTKEQANIAASELYDSARFVKDLTNQVIAAGVFYALSSMVEPDDDDETGLPRITGSVDWKNTRKGERDTMNRTMPPMSIRLGDGTIVSYSRIEPFATMLAGVVDMIRDIHQSGGLNEKALSAYMGSMKNQLDDKTFLSGASDLINAYNDPERFMAKLAGNIVTGFVPNLIRQPIREADPLVRDTKPREEDGFFTSIAKQVGYTLAPGYAPPLMDVWGNPVTRHQGQQIGGPNTDILIRVFDPTNVSYGKQIDPIDRYIFNWNQRTDVKQHLALEPIGNTLTATVGKQTIKIPLTPAEQAQANQNAGKAARNQLGTAWDWKSPTPDGIERIKEVVRRHQNIERDRLRSRKLREMK